MHVPPPAVALGAALAQRALTKGAPPPTRGPLVVGAATALASATLMGAALLQFRRQGTTVDPVHPHRASKLVTTGPNALTRNPMYVGLAGLLLAHAVVRGPQRAVPPVLVFALVVDRFQIAPEEAALRTRFGEAYTTYCSKVPRWLGLPGGATRR